MAGFRRNILGPRTNGERAPNGSRADLERTPNGPRTDPERIPNAPQTDPRPQKSFAIRYYMECNQLNLLQMNFVLCEGNCIVPLDRENAIQAVRALIYGIRVAVQSFHMLP